MNTTQPSMSSGQALWNQRMILKANRKRFENVFKVINHPNDLSLPQYAQLFALTLEFKPTVIIELGRGSGNSTAVFTEAANHLPKTRNILSICLSNSWQKGTVPKLERIVEQKWFEKLDARIANVMDIDITQFVRKNDAVLFFWDAHGFEVAEHVLRNILPKLVNNRHIILVHDITDVRHYPGIKQYGKAGIWKGYPGDDAPYYPYVIVNNKASAFEELILLNDFAERNSITLHSVDHELRTTVFQNTYRLKKIQDLLGENIAKPDSSIYWFFLGSRKKKLIFPHLSQKIYPKKNEAFSFQTSKPLVSIITPCFNSGKYLESCIQSVLNQTYPYVEHIIQDGASTDRTKSILKKYSTKRFAKRIKIVTEPDNGQSDGLNKALQRAKGDILLVLNADDELMPYACSWGVEQLAKNPDCAVVYGDEYFFDENGTIFAIYTGKHPYAYDRIFCVELVPPAQAAFIRRPMLKSVGFFADSTLKTCPDFEMWVRLGARFPMKHEFGVICKYRHHPGSEGRRPEMVAKMVEAKLQVIKRTLNDPHTPASIKALERRAYAGLYHWGANVAHGNGLYKTELKLLLQSLLLRPQLHKIIRLTKFLAYHPPNFLITKMRKMIYV